MTTVPVSWQRRNHICALPNRAVDLIRQYGKLQNDEVTALLSEEEILQRARQAAAAACLIETTNIDNNNDLKNHDENHQRSAEYRCLETGGFLLPTVSYHPWYKNPSDRSAKLQTAPLFLKCSDQCHQSEFFAVLDLGCGLGADGRQMLIDGFATHLVGMDRSDLYLRLGCELFGDCVETTMLQQEAYEGNISLDVGNDGRGRTNVTISNVSFLVADVVQEDDISAKARVALAKQLGITIQVDPNDKDEIDVLPRFDAVYTGKFLHCLETEDNLRIVLGKLRQLLKENGALFGVFGRNFQIPFECADKEDFTNVLSTEGFSVPLVVEENAGATWFCAFKKTS